MIIIGKHTKAIIRFFLYFCLLFFSFKPTKIDRSPIGINNHIIHEYLSIPATPNISASPIMLANANEAIGEIKVNKNKTVPIFLLIFILL